MSVASCIEDVDRSLKACQVTTSAEDEVKNLCERWQAALVSFIESYDAIDRCNDHWRQEVFRGVSQNDPSKDQLIKDLFQRWLSLDSEAQKWIVVIASQRCESGMRVAADYQRRVNEAKEILAEWSAPKPSDDPMLRELTLNRDQSRKIKEMLGSDW